MNGIDGRDVPFEAQATRSDMKKIRRRVIELKGSRCQICGFDCIDILEVHHVLDVAKGGMNFEDNLTVLCPNCHALAHKIQELQRKAQMNADETDQMERISQWISHNLNRAQDAKLMEVFGE